MIEVNIIIPTYNEQENIKKLVESIFKAVPKSKITIVDDSKHNKVGLALIKKFKKNKLKYIHRKNSRGRGSAVLHGLKSQISKNKKQIFIEMDADFSHNPLELKRNIKQFIKIRCDVLIASRYLSKSKILNWSMSRRIFSILSNFLAKMFLDIGVSDYTNGFRIYSKNSVKLILKNCGKIGDGFIVLSEILLIVYLNKLKINEIDTVFINRKRGESSVNLRLIFQSFFGLIKLYRIKINKNY
jgi:dolichol-phosphate mannosyltransferase